MSFSYDRYERSTNRRFLTGPHNRTAFGYWIPLAITVTAATAGLAAWVLNERSKDVEEEEEYVYEQDYESDYDERRVEEERERWRKEYGETGPAGEVASKLGEHGSEDEEGLYGAPGVPPPTTEDSREAEGGGFMAQMRGALGRTPSPQQLMQGAKESFNAGVAAVGKGLNSIREGSEEGGGDYFGDQERWSEEAESRERTDDVRRDIGAIGAAAAAGGALVGAGAGATHVAGNVASGRQPGKSSKGKSRMVCVVVSAETPTNSYGDDEDGPSYQVEHASLLSHLIGHVNPDNTQMLILIYAPHLEKHPLASAPSQASKSRRTSTGSYDKLSDSLQQDENEKTLQQQAPIPLEDNDDGAEGRIINSYTSQSNPSLYNALATQAATLVSHPTHILPFTSPTGHVHMLKHLAPSLVYVQESLCGERGQLVQDVEGWIGQCVVVVGAEGAGLVDTETEDEGSRQRSKGGKWWQDDRRVGLGKGVEIVESMKLGEDWMKRVEGT